MEKTKRKGHNKQSLTPVADMVGSGQSAGKGRGGSENGYHDKEGLEEGLKEGLEKSSTAIARRLKARGRPIDEIAEDTGFSREFIEKL